jgi:hypothetical protein
LPTLSCLVRSNFAEVSRTKASSDRRTFNILL